MPNDSILAETVTITGNNGDAIEAYAARCQDSTPRGGIVVIHHLPGYDIETKEITRRFAAEGYNAVCPNLYSREAPGADPDDAAAAARAQGGVADEQVVGDVAGAAAYLKGLSNSNGKVATIGYCSGGRQSWVCAGNLQLDAAIVCYPGLVVGEKPEQMSHMKMDPVPELAATISCPLLGLFGKEDQQPAPKHVAEIDQLLDEHGKAHEFHSYDDAGHAFFAVNRPAYRPKAAVDGWEKIFGFLGKHLAA